MLGGQLCFSTIPTINWYRGPLKHRLIRLVIGNFCIIPSWVFCYFQNDIVNNQKVRDIGLRNLYIDLIHFILLYYMLFALVPLAFHKMKFLF